MYAISAQTGSVPLTAVRPPVIETECATGTARHVVWVEVPATRLSRSIAFFETVLGAHVERQTLFGVEAALLPAASGAESDDGEGSDVVQLAVKAPLADALDRVLDAGGAVLSDIIAVADGGHFAYCATPEGFRFGLYSEE